MNWTAAKPCIYDPNSGTTNCCCQSGDGCNGAIDMVNGIGYAAPLASTPTNFTALDAPSSTTNASSSGTAT